MRLKGSWRKILAGLALALALRLSAWGQTPEAQPPSEGEPRQENSSPTLPAMGSMSSYEGLTVQAINFPDLPPTSARRLLDLLPQKAGAPLERERVRQSIQALHATGRFADIQVEAERTAGNQVVLSLLTRPNFFVGEISVEGAPDPPAANQIVNATKLQLGELFTRKNLSAPWSTSSS